MGGRGHAASYCRRLDSALSPRDRLAGSLVTPRIPRDKGSLPGSQTVSSRPEDYFSGPFSYTALDTRVARVAPAVPLKNPAKGNWPFPGLQGP